MSLPGFTEPFSIFPVTYTSAIVLAMEVFIFAIKARFYLMSPSKVHLLVLSGICNNY